jgi:hypothetical protein
MIPYADLERAIARWRARQAGHDVPSAVHEVSSESVMGEAYAETPEHDVGDSGLISIQDDVTKV